jgi:hypothetical protein
MQKNMDMSRHGILATGCIHALPKASNLFHWVVFRAAFPSVLDAVVWFFDVEFFFVVGVEERLDFAVGCCVLGCEAA